MILTETKSTVTRFTKPISAIELTSQCKCEHECESEYCGVEFMVVGNADTANATTSTTAETATAAEAFVDCHLAESATCDFVHRRDGTLQIQINSHQNLSKYPITSNLHQYIRIFLPFALVTFAAKISAGNIVWAADAPNVSLLLAIDINKGSAAIHAPITTDTISINTNNGHIGLATVTAAVTVTLGTKSGSISGTIYQYHSLNAASSTDGSIFLFLQPASNLSVSRVVVNTGSISLKIVDFNGFFSATCEPQNLDSISNNCVTILAPGGIEKRDANQCSGVVGYSDSDDYDDGYGSINSNNSNKNRVHNSRGSLLAVSKNGNITIGFMQAE
ncbi:hypothetical protein HK100_006149 [Physocladia obscura]|uniref:Adhesin domain-containing protein n=1 Tax=Physocladia obscura TaxID=109957 RepID=A0AAD5XBV4_9FUNG|nr:hypothetical protein HK100_006149 [Physocladia obscura]